MSHTDFCETTARDIIVSFPSLEYIYFKPQQFKRLHYSDAVLQDQDQLF